MARLKTTKSIKLRLLNSLFLASFPILAIGIILGLSGERNVSERITIHGQEEVYPRLFWLGIGLGILACLMMIVLGPIIKSVKTSEGHKDKDKKTTISVKKEIAVKIFCIVSAIGLLTFFIGIYYHPIMGKIKESFSNTFDEYLDEYMHIPELKESTQNPYITKKVVIISFPRSERHKAKIDFELWSHLPKDIRASNPREVGTVVWIEYGRKHVGYYRDTVSGVSVAPAMQLIWEATIIDKTIPAIICQKDFEGAFYCLEIPYDPEKPRRDVEGPAPTDELIAFLKGLPRK